MSRASYSAHTPAFVPAPDPRIVTDVIRSEDGWSIEVEDARGVRMTYWIAGADECIPRVGDTARFYGGVSGMLLHGLEINGCRVFFEDMAAD